MTPVDRTGRRPEDPVGGDTADAGYAERLRRLEGAWWKRLLDVQAPYRWNLRRLALGRTLDVGCGLGRNLRNLGPDSVGVDHNSESVRIAQQRGLRAYTVADFLASEHAIPGSFDSLLLAHVVEHLPEPEAERAVGRYLPYLRDGGLVLFITPQERGYASDSTHVRFCGFPEVTALARSLGLTVQRQYSFPFPRFAGRLFPYNEFNVLTRKPGA
ncbi:MAG TPA: class I SAM-dependent methyltransferase [Micromonosporaceae bacterium]|nr:class I SAM-dependent methyltransferase [Micromonosporaceae bacterium]